MEARFGRVPQKYITLLREAENQHNICIRIIDEMRPGYSGALLYEAIVSPKTESPCNGATEISPHGVWRLIIKLDSLENTDEHEGTKLIRARQYSSPRFLKHIVSEHLFPVRVGHEIAYFYSIAGNSTFVYKPLRNFNEKEYLSKAFSTLFTSLVEEWDPQKRQRFVMPRDMMIRWLDDDPERLRKALNQNLEDFGVSDNTPGLIINNVNFPNPVHYLFNRKLPPNGFPALEGLLHRDLHIGNVLVAFTRSGDLDDFVLIDFDYFKKKDALFYDQMYLELSYLLDQFDQGNLQLHEWYSLLKLLAAERTIKVFDEENELGNAFSVINSGRMALEGWIDQDPSRSSQKDILWLQINLASIAVGLNFFRKRAISRDLKWAAMCYAAAHLELIRQQFQLEEASRSSRFDINKRQAEDEATREGTWQSLVDYCENFSNEYLYILVIGPMSNVSRLAQLGRVRWAVVLDFDSNLKENSYKHIGRELNENCSLHLVTKESQNEISHYIPVRAAYWYAAMGLSGGEDTNEYEDVRKWAQSHIGSVRSFLQKIGQSSSHMPVRCIVCWDDVEYLERIVTMLGEEIFVERIKFAFVSTNNNISILLHKVSEGRYFDLSSEYLAASVGRLMTSQYQSVEVLLPAGVERDSDSTAVIETRDVNWIEENFSIIHLNIGQKEDPNNPVSQFYRGRVIDWFGLRIDSDVRRTSTEEIQRGIMDDLGSRSTIQYSLYHSPGGGGTTVARRIAWNIHKSYPVLIMKRYVPESIFCIEHIFRKTQRSTLIIVDRMVGLTHESLQAFYTELTHRHLPAVVVVLTRSRDSVENPNKRRIFLSETLDDEESRRFYQAYKDEAPEKIDQLEDLLRIDFPGHNKKLLTPFYFGLLAFEKEFQQLDSYINEKLEGATGVQKKIMLYLALAELYSKQEIPAQYFGKLIGLPGEASVSLQRVLSRGQQKLLIFDPEENSWKVSHYLIAEEIRNQILDPSPRHTAWNSLLVRWLVEFIDYFAKISSENEQPDEFILDLMFQIFIDREQGSVEDIDTGRFHKLVFSPLVTELPKSVSSELNEEGGLVVLRKLTESFPDPHFQAHYARRLSHNQDHMRATREALKAVQHERAKTDYILWHIYGTVRKRHIDALVDEYLKQLDESTDGLRDSSGLDKIKDLFLQADHAFSQSLKVEKNEYAYISLVSLLIKQIEFNFEISRSEKIQTFLQDNPSFLHVLERAESLLDESKYLIRNYEANKYYVGAQNMIKSAYGDFDGIIESWRELLSGGVGDPAPIRRSLVRALLQRKERDWDQLEESELAEIIELMNQNFLDDTQNSMSNIKLWFDAARRSSLDINSVIERVKAWENIEEDSLEAKYYLYICYVIKSFDEPSKTMRKNAETSILRLSTISNRADIFDPNFSFNLLGMGRGLKRLVYHKKVGKLNDENWYKDQQGQDLLYRVSGTISGISGPTKGVITLNNSRLRAHFTPGHIRRLGDGSQSEPFLRGRDVHLDVTFFLGFSYNGLRAYDVTRS